MKREEAYQFSLLFFAFLVVFGIGVFVYKELFPDYKVYQETYKELEAIRGSIIHEEPPPYQVGIKQILIPTEGGGPELIDRCISCHVAMDLPHFSPLHVARDVNDQVVIDANGKPLLEPNPDYVWSQVEDPELKQPHLVKALQMHPLIGDETVPFQYHPMEEYGCTTCHSGNGRALVAKRAHGAVYDGEYEPAYDGGKPQFTEIDPENDPPFARMYNEKPGHELAFQTTPILAGDLIVAKCVQCHLPASSEVQAVIDKVEYFTDQKTEQLEMIKQGIEHDKAALLSLLQLRKSLELRGREGTLDWLDEKLTDYHLSSDEIDAFEGQRTFLASHSQALPAIEEQLTRITGSKEVSEELLQRALETDPIEELAHSFEGGSIEAKRVQLLEGEQRLALAQSATPQPADLKGLETPVDKLIVNYERGKELFISQACYACHRIDGFSRSSVGPELTKAGLSYPWYIKESIVWPQADLPSSTMPNFRLDHEELSDLMTFLMAQTGQTKAISEVDHQISMREWEGGAKMPWERRVPPELIEDVEAGMRVYASEGCAACHKLEGFESSVQLVSGDEEWFYRTIPEQIPGSKLAEVLKTRAAEIDAHIEKSDSKKGMLEELEAQFPGLIEGFYTNFKFASRVPGVDLERLHRVLMVYIEEYGLGRDIAPHLNWSGVYRDDAWLMGHFKDPTAYTAKSIMPVMPFDETKFYQLTHLLHALGEKNRNELREIWDREGFNPPLAFELLCSTCHGLQRQGNGIISEWIYPIPKNLRNPVFLRQLTKEQAIQSIQHGVKGTPMPPWGERAPEVSGGPVLDSREVKQLVNWLYQGLPHERTSLAQREGAKWHYYPEDVIEEMKNEGELLAPNPSVAQFFEVRPNPSGGPEKELFYIRDLYYTPENLAAGEAYYQVNCATCHGADGGGTGLRASSMIEAKPRMLTNLPWLSSRDDLRLLRSIKYGVHGTAMIPWGDQTTARQRMQLVMYIRDLTRTQVLSNELESVLFDHFDRRILDLYTDEKAPQQVIDLLQDERRHFRAVGVQLIAAGLPKEEVGIYFELIRAPEDKELFEMLLDYLDVRIEGYTHQIEIEEGKLDYPDRGKKIGQLLQARGTFINLRTKLVVQLADAKKLREKRQKIYG